MRLDYKKFVPEFEELWDRFVEEQSINGTFLHTRKFYNHNTANAREDCSLLFFKKGKLVALFPAACYTKGDHKVLHSHPRATYGGLIMNNEVGVEDAVEAIGHIVSYSRDLNTDEVIIRNPFRIFNSQLADESDYAMWYHGFSIKSREVETAIELNGYEKVYKCYDDSTKRSVKKSLKSLKVQVSNDYGGYWKILEDNLIKKHGAKPTHSFEDFQNLLRNIGEQRIKLFLAEKDGHIAGGIIVFVVNNKGLHAQYIASDEAHQEFRPLNAVIDHIIRWGCEQGYSYFNLGTSNTEAGRVINSGLFRFKEGFGGRSVLRETMHLLSNNTR